MPGPVLTRSPIKVLVNASHRNGICIECGVKVAVQDVDIGGKVKKRSVCPKCGGMKGQLIAKPVSIHAPNPPACISFKCLWKFFIDVLFIAILSSYHRRRVTYAEHNRPENKTILDKYRIGKPAPQTLRQAIWADFKLKYHIY